MLALNFAFSWIKLSIDFISCKQMLVSLSSMFESKGITKDKTVIVYCETSVRAGIIYLALKGLGYPNVKVYDGAYLEWQSIDSNEIG